MRAPLLAVTLLAGEGGKGLEGWANAGILMAMCRGRRRGMEAVGTGRVAGGERAVAGGEDGGVCSAAGGGGGGGGGGGAWSCGGGGVRSGDGACTGKRHGEPRTRWSSSSLVDNVGKAGYRLRTAALNSSVISMATWRGLRFNGGAAKAEKLVAGGAAAAAVAAVEGKALIERGRSPPSRSFRYRGRRPVVVPTPAGAALKGTGAGPE